MTIPRIIIRSVQETVDPEQERLWQIVRDLHPGWDCTTYRDPITPRWFPITSPAWHLCKSGAQLAGLVRLEALFTGGGIWLDSDVEMYRPLTPLLGLDAFAGYEDPGVVPDAVIGASPEHPALWACLQLALARIRGEGDPTSFMTNTGAWSTGPGVTTTIFPGRDDVLLLPPGSFYPYHYTVKDTEADVDHRTLQPWSFGAHHWRNSWQ